jgi:polysaccharide export outer membrane protein
MMKQILRWTLFALACLLIAPCFAAPKGYVMGPADVIKITIFQNPEMATETRVSESGTITFPLVGTVEIGGLTTAQAEVKIAALLKSGNFVPRAQVTVFVTQFRSRQVSVLGQVNHPGRFAVEEPTIRLTDVLAMAGGIISPFGADTVTIIRPHEPSDDHIEIDLLGLFDVPAPFRNIEILNGDTVFVPRAPVVYVYGEVQHPGAYRLERKMTVIQAVSLAGGFTLRGSEKGLRIKRRTLKGTSNMFSASGDDYVLPDDVIYAKENLF